MFNIFLKTTVIKIEYFSNIYIQNFRVVNRPFFILVFVMSDM